MDNSSPANTTPSPFDKVRRPIGFVLIAILAVWGFLVLRGSKAEQREREVVKQIEDLEKSMETGLPQHRETLEDQAEEVADKLRAAEGTPKAVLLRAELYEIAEALIRVDQYEAGCNQLMENLEAAKRRLERMIGEESVYGTPQDDFLAELDRLGRETKERLAANPAEYAGSLPIDRLQIEGKVQELIED